VPEALIAKLQERVRAGAPRKVYIRADVRVHYRAVKGVLASVHSAGLTERFQSCCAGKDSPPGAAVPHSRSTKHYGQPKFCGPAALGWV